MSIIKQIIWCCVALVVVQAALVVLRLTEILVWDWWIVLIPAMVALITMIAIGIIIIFFSQKLTEKSKKSKTSKYERPRSKRKK